MKTLSRGSQHLQDALARFPLLKGAAPEVIARLAAESRVLEYGEGESLLLASAPADHGFALLEGSVRVFYASDEGGQVTVKLFRAPSFFGEMETLLGINHLEGVVALEKVEVIRIPQNALHSALQSSNDFSYNLLLDVCARLCIAAQNEYNLAFLDVDVRLAGFVLSYAKNFGREHASEIRFERPLTQQALADAVGATTRSVQRTLDGWRDLGIIKGKGRSLVVKDVGALQRLAGSKRAHIDYQLTHAGRPEPKKADEGVHFKKSVA